MIVGTRHTTWFTVLLLLWVRAKKIKKLSLIGGGGTRGVRTIIWQRRGKTAGGLEEYSNACALCACVRWRGPPVVTFCVCVRACVRVRSLRRGGPPGIDAAVTWPRSANGGAAVGSNGIPVPGATYVQRPQPRRPPFCRRFLRINTNFEFRFIYENCMSTQDK